MTPSLSIASHARGINHVKQISYTMFNGRACQPLSPSSAAPPSKAAQALPSCTVFKALILVSIQTATNVAPGVSSARIHARYRCCDVAKFCEALSLLNMFPPQRETHAPRTEAGATRGSIYFLGGALTEISRDSHSLGFLFTRESKQEEE